METTMPVFAKSREVRGGTISFVSGKSVLRKLKVVNFHQIITVCFGENGRSGYRCRDRITFDDHFLR
jgi:hypothetical protein